MALTETARLAYRISRTEGPRWLAYRVKYAARRRLGIVSRQLPAKPWTEVDLSSHLFDPTLADASNYLAYRRDIADRFFFTRPQRDDAANVLEAFDTDGSPAVTSADEMLDGYVRMFAHTRMEVGENPGWSTNVFSGVTAPTEQHWSKINDFNHGDIKIIWDVSRFGFTYSLVRAYWRTADDRYAKRFWTLVESWLNANPPQIGPNWKCGQEASLRVMAWCFGLYGFIDSPETTPERVHALGRAIALIGEKVNANIEYALSQRNNHGMSEAMGLWTIGSLFLIKASSSWKAPASACLKNRHANWSTAMVPSRSTPSITIG